MACREKDKVGTFTTNATGDGSVTTINTTPYLLTDQFYYIKELIAPQGYELDTQIHKMYLDGGSSLTLLERPKTATVRFYVDGAEKPIGTINRMLGASLTTTEPKVQDFTKQATKPNCTPGLKAWYFDRSLTKPFIGTKLTGDLDLFGRNIATLTYTTTPGSALTPGMEIHLDQNRQSKALSLIPDILPKPTEKFWGGVSAPAPLKHPVLYHFDGQRWRTLRTRDGWHDNPAATGKPVTSIKMLQDMTLYADYSISTFDGYVAS